MAMVLVRRRASSGFARMRPTVTRTRTRVVKAARKVGVVVKKKAWDKKHKLASVATGFAVGYLEKNGQLAMLPHFGPLGVTGTYGLGLAFAADWFKSPVMDHISTGLLTLAAYGWSSKGSMMGAGDDYSGGVSDADMVSSEGEDSEGEDSEGEDSEGADVG